MAVGGISSAYLEEYYTPYHVYFLSSILVFGISLSSYFISDDMETNKYATMVDTTENMYYRSHDGVHRDKMGVWEITKIRLESLKEAVKEPVV